MVIDQEKKHDLERINTFNKLMINTIKVKEDKFEFEDKNYTVSSDGVCVQTLINDRFLYRIFAEGHGDNSLVSSKLVNYL